jgi:dTDP-4-amino-4,6-dideoxygalactose transaminase
MAGTTDAVAMSSGTAALVAAVKALGLGPEDEVITSPFTFAATLTAVIEAGAVVRLVDIDPHDYTIDPELVAAAITPATKAIMPVHLYGYPADMQRLEEIAAGSHIPIIEDAAQAHGARVGSRPVGTWGMGAFSFYATKNITTGEGGMVTTNNPAWADRLRLLRNQGMRARYEYELPGHNYRMTELQAAIGLAQLNSFEEWSARRRSNAQKLTAALDGTKGVELPFESAERHHAYHQYTIRVSESAAVSRDDLSKGLGRRGIETAIYYPRVAHDYECYRSHPQVRAAPVPHAQRAAQEVLSLPVHQWLKDDDIDEIAQAVTEVLSDTPH